MYFEASLTPQEIFIEAEDEDEFKEKIKHISIENFIYKSNRISKEKLQKELANRHIFLKL